MNRQAWLMKAVDILKHDFDQIGEIIPEVSITAEWVEGSFLGTYSAIGSDGNDTEAEICISSRMVNALSVLDILVHELVHAVVGIDVHHGVEFCRVAAAIGLNDSGSSALAEEVLMGRLREIEEILGMYPEV